ncbi:nestin [Erpetoichthys calabaricus]|uniref:nestin n=1 Tax=Erpetoichthys calabaricus TaxID=27687 RepID=UPI002234CA52|nr:nestin [Erpetoichthys calabaricus]
MEQTIGGSRQQLGQEKYQMWDLNKRLESYLSRVKFLEEENDFLRGEIQHLKRNQDARSWKSEFEEELCQARQKLEDAWKELDKAEMDKDRMSEEVDLLRSKRQKEQEAQGAIKKQLSDMKKALEEERRAQIWLKEKAAQLEQELLLEVEAHQDDSSSVKAQISAAAPVLTQSTYAHHSLQVEDFGKCYAERASEMWKAMTEAYDHQISHLEESLAQAKAQLIQVSEEKKANCLRLQGLTKELEATQGQKKLIEKNMAERWAQQRKELEKIEALIETLEMEKEALSDQISHILNDRQQLMQLKMSLCLEVATYRALLDAESLRVKMPLGELQRSSFRKDIKLDKSKGLGQNVHSPLVSTAESGEAHMKKSSPQFYTPSQTKSFMLTSTPFVPSEESPKVPQKIMTATSLVTESTHQENLNATVETKDSTPVSVSRSKRNIEEVLSNSMEEVTSNTSPPDVTHEKVTNGTFSAESSASMRAFDVELTAEKTTDTLTYSIPLYDHSKNGTSSSENTAEHFIKESSESQDYLESCDGSKTHTKAVPVEVQEYNNVDVPDSHQEPITKEQEVQITEEEGNDKEITKEKTMNVAEGPQFEHLACNTQSLLMNETETQMTPVVIHSDDTVNTELVSASTVNYVKDTMLEHLDLKYTAIEKAAETDISSDHHAIDVNAKGKEELQHDLDSPRSESTDIAVQSISTNSEMIKDQTLEMNDTEQESGTWKAEDSSSTVVQAPIDESEYSISETDFLQNAGKLESNQNDSTNDITEVTKEDAESEDSIHLVSGNMDLRKGSQEIITEQLTSENDFEKQNIPETSLTNEKGSLIESTESCALDGTLVDTESHTIHGKIFENDSRNLEEEHGEEISKMAEENLFLKESEHEALSNTMAQFQNPETTVSPEVLKEDFEEKIAEELRTETNVMESLTQEGMEVAMESEEQTELYTEAEIETDEEAHIQLEYEATSDLEETYEINQEENTRVRGDSEGLNGMHVEQDDSLVNAIKEGGMYSFNENALEYDKNIQIVVEENKDESIATENEKESSLQSEPKVTQEIATHLTADNEENFCLPEETEMAQEEDIAEHDEDINSNNETHADIQITTVNQDDFSNDPDKHLVKDTCLTTDSEGSNLFKTEETASEEKVRLTEEKDEELKMETQSQLPVNDEGDIIQEKEIYAIEENDKNEVPKQTEVEEEEKEPQTLAIKDDTSLSNETEINLEKVTNLMALKSEKCLGNEQGIQEKMENDENTDISKERDTEEEEYTYNMLEKEKDDSLSKETEIVQEKDIQTYKEIEGDEHFSQKTELDQISEEMKELTRALEEKEIDLGEELHMSGETEEQADLFKEAESERGKDTLISEETEGSKGSEMDHEEHRQIIIHAEEEMGLSKETGKDQEEDTMTRDQTENNRETLEEIQEDTKLHKETEPNMEEDLEKDTYIPEEKEEDSILSKETEIDEAIKIPVANQDDIKLSNEAEVCQEHDILTSGETEEDTKLFRVDEIDQKEAVLTSGKTEEDDSLSKETETVQEESTLKIAENQDDIRVCKETDQSRDEEEIEVEEASLSKETEIDQEENTEITVKTEDAISLSNEAEIDQENEEQTELENQYETMVSKERELQKEEEFLTLEKTDDGFSLSKETELNEEENRQAIVEEDIILLKEAETDQDESMALFKEKDSTLLKQIKTDEVEGKPTTVEIQDDIRISQEAEVYQEGEDTMITEKTEEDIKLYQADQTKQEGEKHVSGGTKDETNLLQEFDKDQKLDTQKSSAINNDAIFSKSIEIEQEENKQIEIEIEENITPSEETEIKLEDDKLITTESEQKESEDMVVNQEKQMHISEETKEDGIHIPKETEVDHEESKQIRMEKETEEDGKEHALISEKNEENTTLSEEIKTGQEEISHMRGETEDVITPSISVKIEQEKNEEIKVEIDEEEEQEEQEEKVIMPEEDKDIRMESEDMIDQENYIHLSKETEDTGLSKEAEVHSIVIGKEQEDIKISDETEDNQMKHSLNKEVEIDQWETIHTDIDIEENASLSNEAEIKQEKAKEITMEMEEDIILSKETEISQEQNKNALEEGEEHIILCKEREINQVEDKHSAVEIKEDANQCKDTEMDEERDGQTSRKSEDGKEDTSQSEEKELEKEQIYQTSEENEEDSSNSKVSEVENEDGKKIIAENEEDSNLCKGTDVEYKLASIVSEEEASFHKEMAINQEQVENEGENGPSKQDEIEQEEDTPISCETKEDTIQCKEKVAEEGDIQTFEEIGEEDKGIETDQVEEEKENIILTVNTEEDTNLSKETEVDQKYYTETSKEREQEVHFSDEIVTNQEADKWTRMENEEDTHVSSETEDDIILSKEKETEEEEAIQISTEKDQEDGEIITVEAKEDAKVKEEDAELSMGSEEATSPFQETESTQIEDTHIVVESKDDNSLSVEIEAGQEKETQISGKVEEDVKICNETETGQGDKITLTVEMEENIDLNKTIETDNDQETQTLCGNGEETVQPKKTENLLEEDRHITEETKGYSSWSKELELDSQIIREDEENINVTEKTEQDQDKDTLSSEGHHEETNLYKEAESKDYDNEGLPDIKTDERLKDIEGECSEEMSAEVHECREMQEHKDTDILAESMGGILDEVHKSVDDEVKSQFEVFDSCLTQTSVEEHESATNQDTGLKDFADDTVSREEGEMLSTKTNVDFTAELNLPNNLYKTFENLTEFSANSEDSDVSEADSPNVSYGLTASRGIRTIILDEEPQQEVVDSYLTEIYSAFGDNNKSTESEAHEELPIAQHDHQLETASSFHTLSIEAKPQLLMNGEHKDNENSFSNSLNGICCDQTNASQDSQEDKTEDFPEDDIHHLHDTKAVETLQKGKMEILICAESESEEFLSDEEKVKGICASEEQFLPAVKDIIGCAEEEDKENDLNQ